MSYKGFYEGEEIGFNHAVLINMGLFPAESDWVLGRGGLRLTVCLR